MRRLFWVGVGVAVTVVVLRKGRTVTRRFTPVGIAEQATASVNDLGDRVLLAVRGFGQEFRTARAEREDELVASLLAEGQARPEEVRAARAAKDAAPPTPRGPLPVDEDDPEDGLAFF